MYEINNVHILYPGAFKPLSGAHINLIDQYLKNPAVKHFTLLMSPGKRDNLTSNICYEIAIEILKDYPVQIVLDKNSYSPILACYRWIEQSQRNLGQYSLAASNKDNDYKRVTEFATNYSNTLFKNNLPNGVEVIDFKIDMSPLLYKEGPYKNKPISSTIIRQSLIEKDFDLFKLSYPNLSYEKIQYIWDKLIDHGYHRNVGG